MSLSALERDRVVDAAAKIEEIRARVEPRRDLLHLLRDLECFFEDLRQVHQCADVLTTFIRRQRAAHFGELQRKEVQRDELRREGFR